MPAKKKTGLEVDALRHQATRVNIPTNELHNFVGDGELNPPTRLYPRDEALDPQLVWRGKDAQDAAPLAVPVVPIYIQEKIHPQAIIQTVQASATAAAAAGEQQLDLFSDFNGPDTFEALIEFYQHPQHWANRLILGDSLQVMTSLAEKEGLTGQVQMIYFDPPYGIKFGSNWQVSTRKRDVKDGKAEDLVRQPEQVRAFRDTWEYGIHSYLNYLRDRLTVARELLTERGSIFVQIGDENVHLVRSLLDEVFGAENFIGLIPFSKSTGLGSTFLKTVNDYLVWYGKNRDATKYHQLYLSRLDYVGYTHVQLSDGTIEPLTYEAAIRPSLLPDGHRVFRTDNLSSSGLTPSCVFDYHYNGVKYSPAKNRSWKTNPKGMEILAKAGRLAAYGNTMRYIKFNDDLPVVEMDNFWTDTGGEGDKIYVVQTSRKAIERCILMTTDPGDLVLDPTMGSGTTAYVAEQWGRRWITIDTSRVALALARTRLMSARFPYYLLADSEAGARKEMELLGTVFPPRRYTGDVKAGFVYQRVPHITLRDIANNGEIDTIHAAWEPYLSERLVWLNAALGTAWQAWDVPRELPASTVDPDGAIAAVLAQYWNGRRQRQAEIDESIARNSERETLYDRPYTDPKIVRVTGPFTVESLSPHRVLDAAVAEAAARTNLANIGSYEQLVIDNLRVAGVQNTYKNERITFATLDPFASPWLHAVGTYHNAAGEECRVAVSIGAEHGTVTARQIKEAVKEAAKGLGYDLVLVCGFAFEAAVTEESKRYGSITVQLVRMNSDLLMGSVLKKTASANLFTIFGEPDLAITTDAEGRLLVELRGLDVYDPMTGQLRAAATDEIACWFIDTAYNEESFFVRHAYFLGGEDAYDNLKRALKAEIDEGAWSALYQRRSLPFPRPDTGKIAVKVINHYGDEVLKVYAV